MTQAYQLTNQLNIVLRTSDGAWIPFTEGNKDYNDYQIWLALGNTPDPYVPPVPTKPQVLSSTEFFNRFTTDERTAIFSAAQASPQMLQFVVTAAAATSIDLTDPSVQGGVNSLIGTILTAPRASAILDH